MSAMVEGTSSTCFTLAITVEVNGAKLQPFVILKATPAGKV